MIRSVGSVSYDRIPVLTGARVRLQAYASSHFDAACRMWGDADVVRHIGGQPKPPATVWSSLQRSIGSWAVLGYGYWAVVDIESGAYLGEAGFLEGLRDMTPNIAGTPEAGWCLVKACWGQGIATEVVGLMHDWADHALGRSETVCIIDHGNDASVRLATRYGYSLEATVRLGAGRTQLFRRQPQPRES